MNNTQVENNTATAVTPRDVPIQGIVERTSDTDYMTETAEALALLAGPKPCIHTIYHTYDLPALPKGCEYRYVQLQSREEADGFDITEGWILESTVLESAFYLYFVVDER